MKKSKRENLRDRKKIKPKNLKKVKHTSHYFLNSMKKIKMLISYADVSIEV